jgi:alkaline phosphatase
MLDRFRSPTSRPSIALALAITFALALTALGGCTRVPDASEPAPDPREANVWFAAGRQQVAQSARFVEGQRAARNVILFVGDGMGVSTVTAARILEGQRRGQLGEENRLAFETFSHLALSKTYSVDSQVPDSAGTMTAMVSGVKTLSGALGVDETVRASGDMNLEAARVLTILEEAELRGLATGIVSTARITHATPAGCYAHAPLRSWEDDSRLPAEARSEGFPDIARQLVEFPYGDGLEVALGGGRRHFAPKDHPDPEDPTRPGARLDGRDLTQEWLAARAGSAYVWNRSQLEGLDLAATRHLLGLFEPSHMKWETDRGTDPAGEPSLAEMTAAALEILSRDEDGFFLMVEGGRIDHGHHAGNAYRALADTIALSDAVRVAIESTSAAETLIVVTADHSHTLTIAGYPKRGNPILGLVSAANFFGGGKTEVSTDGLGRPYTTLSYANGPGYTGASASEPEEAHHFGHRPCNQQPPFECSFEGIHEGRPDLSEVDTQSPDFLQEATVPMGSETHAGEDVPIYAEGPRAALFHGVREQNYIYHAMVEALGWTSRGRPTD